MVINDSRRSRWIAASVMAAMFLAGAAAGFAAPRLFEPEPPRDERPEPRFERDGRRGGRHSIFEELNLTPEQQVKRDSILQKNKRQLDAFWKQHGPAMRAIADSTKAEFDRLLTPEQRAKMQEFRERRMRERQEWEKRNGERPGGAPGRGPDGMRPQGSPRPDGAFFNPDNSKGRLYT